MSEMKPLNSSFLDGCVYIEDKQELKIAFSNGKDYTYKDVPKDVFEGLCNAESAGKYYTQNIKGQYEED